MVFGDWQSLRLTGIQKFIGPFPAWMPAARAAVIFMLVPILIVTVNQLMTLKEDSSLINSSPSLKFTAAGVSFLIVFCVLAALGSFLSVGKYTQISFTSVGSQILAVYGFFSMIVFGAIYFIVPRVTQSEWGSSNGIQSHLVISMYSIVALTVLHFLDLAIRS